MIRQPNARRKVLIIPRFLDEMAEDNRLRNEESDRGYTIIQKWADLEQKGRLAQKETAMDANFLREISVVLWHPNYFWQPF
ncbi:MAG TPA: hypothetical protein VMG59_11780 [Phycisphaerae bacterium]|nr:hypothetical protein [Phycisphaerae bacterium]